jgi:hypothetical protein
MGLWQGDQIGRSFVYGAIFLIWAVFFRKSQKYPKLFLLSTKAMHYFFTKTVGLHFVRFFLQTRQVTRGYRANDPRQQSAPKFDLN